MTEQGSTGTRLSISAADVPQATPQPYNEGGEQGAMVETPQSTNPTEVVEQATTTEVGDKPKGKRPRIAITTEEATEPEVKDAKWWENHHSEKVKEYEKELGLYKQVFERPYLKKFLQAEQEGKDVMGELQKLISANPKDMGNMDVFKQMLRDDGVTDEDDMASEIERFEELTPYMQRKTVEHKRAQLEEQYTKNMSDYDINKFYEKSKPDEKIVTFVTELADSVSENSNKPLDFLAGFVQTEQITHRLEDAIKKGADGGFTAGIAKNTKHAYTNLLLSIAPEEVLTYFINVGRDEALEEKLVDSEARPLIKAGQTAGANNDTYARALKGKLKT